MYFDKTPFTLGQDEVETGREELTFKSHRISDLEQALRREKEHSTSLTADMQVCITCTHATSAALCYHVLCFFTRLCWRSWLEKWRRTHSLVQNYRRERMASNK